MLSPDEILRLARLYAVAEGCSLSTVGLRACGNNRLFARLQQGAGANTRTLARVEVFLRANWPDDAAWPTDLAPGPQRRQRRRSPALAAILALVVAGSAHADRYDPHLLLLAWPGRQEVAPATTPEACEAAVDAIAHHRWLADDPPAEARCVKGNGFPAGWDCIQGFNCRGQ